MRLRILLSVGFFLLATGEARAAQGEERERIDVSQRGPQAGERIPDFTLTDQDGETWTRESIAGPNGTMLQPIVLEGDLESQGLLRGRDSVTIHGTLRYQACDAEICYVPGSAPLSWTLNLRSLVFR